MEKLGRPSKLSLILTNLKNCKKCRQVKPLNKFTLSKFCKYGRSNICRKCQNKLSNDWKKKNSERLSKKRRKQYDEDQGKWGKTHIKSKYYEFCEKNPNLARAQQMRRGLGQRKKHGFFVDPSINTQHIYNMLYFQSNCECCKKPFGIKFKFNGQKSDLSPTIDRVDNSKDYTLENIALICWRCNNLKRDANSKELQIIVNWMKKKGV